MRVYISGKMTGCPDLNRSTFDSAAERLREQGHFVINPHRIGELFGTAEELTALFKEYYRMLELDANFLDHTPSTQILERIRIARSVMDADIAAVRSCDAIYLLRGWESSRGAKKELAEALAHGLQIMQEGGTPCAQPTSWNATQGKLCFSNGGRSLNEIQWTEVL